MLKAINASSGHPLNYWHCIQRSLIEARKTQCNLRPPLSRIGVLNCIWRSPSSISATASYGLSQGLVIGACLLVVYVNNLPDVLNIPYLLCVDDVKRVSPR